MIKKKRKKRTPKRLKSWNRYIWSALLLFLLIGWFYPIIGAIALVCMLAPVIYSAFQGKRKWCVTFCPRGIFNDVLLKRISQNREIPRFFKSTGFKVVFLAFLMYNFYTGISNAFPNPVQIGRVFLKLISLTTAITILLGIVFHPRTWCAFCPMGFMSNLVIFIRRAWQVKTPTK